MLRRSIALSRERSVRDAWRSFDRTRIAIDSIDNERWPRSSRCSETICHVHSTRSSSVSTGENRIGRPIPIDWWSLSRCQSIAELRVRNWEKWFPRSNINVERIWGKEIDGTHHIGVRSTFGTDTWFTSIAWRTRLSARNGRHQKRLGWKNERFRQSFVVIRRRLVGGTEGAISVMRVERRFDEHLRVQRLMLIDGIQGDFIRRRNRATVELDGDR